MKKEGLEGGRKGGRKRKKGESGLGPGLGKLPPFKMAEYM